MKIYDQVLWERNVYTKPGLTPCACQQRYPLSNFSMSDPLPFVRSFVQCPVSNPLSNVQCPPTRVAGEGGYSATLQTRISISIFFLQVQNTFFFNSKTNMKTYDQVLWERNVYTKHGLTPCAFQQRYPMSNFSTSDPLPFVTSFVQCPVSNLSVSNPLSNVQCTASRVAGEGGGTLVPCNF